MGFYSLVGGRGRCVFMNPHGLLKKFTFSFSPHNADFFLFYPKKVHLFVVVLNTDNMFMFQLLKQFEIKLSQFLLLPPHTYT